MIFFNENGIGDGGVGVGVGDSLNVPFATETDKQKFAGTLPTLNNGNAIPRLNGRIGAISDNSLLKINPFVFKADILKFYGVPDNSVLNNGLQYFCGVL